MGEVGRLDVRVDRDACRGVTMCVHCAPGTFSLDDDGRAVATNPPRDAEEAILAAERSCPNFAISVTRLSSEPLSS